MRKAIVYASVHHGNTEKLVKGIAEECQVDLIDAVKQPDVDLSSYDMIGFASGIYFSKFHQSILGFAEKNLPDDKKVFLICTYGGSANYKSIEQILDEKRSKVIGKFGCKGYDTFGPFKLVGGIAKGHPDEEENFTIFYKWTNGKWMVQHLHHSTPDLEQMDGEEFPLALGKQVKKTRQALHALGTAYYHISRLNLKTKKIELVKRSREMDMGIKENTVDWDPQFKIIEDISCKN